MLNLVTGATGPVGSYLVETLTVRGDKVRALVRPKSQADRLRSLGVDIRIGNLRDNATLVAAAQGVDRIYHCASLVRDWGPDADFQETNVHGTRNILAAATRARVSRFIYLSTSDVYGYPGRPVDETELLSPRGFPYADSMIEAENLVWSHAKRVGLPVTVLRPATVYGPGADLVVGETLHALMERRLFLVDQGQHNAGLTYVGNLIDAMLLAADQDAAINQAYNISDGSEVTWAEFVHGLAQVANYTYTARSRSHDLAYAMATLWETLYRLLGRNERPPMTRMMVEWMGTSQEIRIDKARNQLGYSPRVGFEEGMRYTAQWLRQAGILDALIDSAWVAERTA